MADSRRNKALTEMRINMLQKLRELIILANSTLKSVDEQCYVRSSKSQPLPSWSEPVTELPFLQKENKFLSPNL